MSTKLIISVDGLLLTNTSTVVSSRSIDEVILVGTSAEFNNLTANQRTQLASRKASNIGSASLSVALANEQTATLSDDFYNWLSENNISFFNDSGLQSLSSSLVLTSTGSETFTSISADKLVNFDSTTITENKLYQSGGSLSLGSNFASKPTITVSNPSYLDDLSGSIVVNISAAKFASLLAANTTGSKISVSELTNLIVAGDSSDSADLGRSALVFTDVEDNYDGTNRIKSGRNYYWNNKSPIEISVLQALRLPDSGSKEWEAKVTLKDTAENLSVALKAFSEGQIQSFSEVLISDNNTLLLDPNTFALFDKANVSETWSLNDGTTLKNSSGSTGTIELKGTLSEFTTAGLWDGSSLATSLTSSQDAANLLSQVNKFVITGVITSTTDITNHKAALQALTDAGMAFETNLTFSASNFASEITTSAFTDLAELDALTTQNLFLYYFQ